MSRNGEYESTLALHYFNLAAAFLRSQMQCWDGTELRLLVAAVNLIL